jgi:NAD(P)-dependent dehydrogenase (short-subunit alcohol dehydrogenase family)
MTTEPAPREPQLTGQTVLVIGGSSGIGLETARRARAEGAEVVITGRNAQRLATAGADVGARAAAAFDATDPDALDRFFRGLPGPVDHVMVTAGGSYPAAPASVWPSRGSCRPRRPA